MSRTFLTNDKPSYLDITEFVVKQHSPLFKPHPNHHQQHLSEHSDITPELSPILDGSFSFSITPLFESSKDPAYDHYQIWDYDEFASFELQTIEKPKKTKKIQKTTGSRPRLYSGWLLIENDLENILEEDECFDENSESSEQNPESEHMSEEDLEEESEDFQDQSSLLNVDASKYSVTSLQINKNQISSYEWENHHPKPEIISFLKNICIKEEGSTEEEKIELIKQKIKYYLFEYEYYFFEEAFAQLSGPLKDIVKKLITGVEEAFQKNIGGLNFQKRRLKILKYMEKKKGRVWRKKINYNCRKQVADKRLRIKGKFVTQEQALEQLGLDSVKDYSPNELKQMLVKKIQQQ